MKQILKKCPKCAMTYTDDSMNFCLSDGNPLSEIVDSNSESETIEMSDKTTEQVIAGGVGVVHRKILKTVGADSWSVEYPQVQGIKSQYIQSRINNYLRKQFARELREALESEKEKNFDYEEVRDGKANPETVEITYQICLLTNELLSVQRNFYQEAEMMAHPNHYYDSLIIDLNSGYQLIYNDLFRLESDYRYRIPELISISLAAEYGVEWEEREAFEFSLFENHLEIINLFDNHASRAITVDIKYSDIIDIIHPESPLGKHLGIK